MRAPGYNLTVWPAVCDGLQKFKRKQTAVRVTETTAMASLQIVLKKTTDDYSMDEILQLQSSFMHHICSL